MTYLQNISQNIYSYRVAYIRALGCSVGLLLAVYGYLVVGIIYNGSAIEHMEQKISVASSELGDLEAKYLALKNSISITEAYALGFVEVEDPVYLSRKDGNAVALGN